MSDNRITLEYGRPPMLARKVRRWALAVLAAGAIVVALRVWVYPIVKPQLDHWALLRHQERLMTWTWPSGHVAYSDDPARVAQLRKDQRYDRLSYGRASNRISEATSTHDWPAGMGYAYSDSLPIKAGRQQVPSLFRHRRFAPDGKEWLASMGAWPFALSPQRRVVLITQVTFLPIASAPGSVATERSFMGLGVDLTPDDRLTLFAGQIDPTDPARFFIPYQLNDQRGTIDCWLHHNGYINMKVRDGPARLISLRDAAATMPSQ